MFTVTPLVLRWSVRHADRSASGSLVSALHALRIRVVNNGAALADAPLRNATLITTAGQRAVGEPLFELTGIAAGETREGWLLFHLLDRADGPHAFMYVDDVGTLYKWALTKSDVFRRV